MKQTLLRKFFLNNLALEEIKDVPLDSPERTQLARSIIEKKKFLRRFYTDIYSHFESVEKSLENIGGESLEIGSGGGFLKEILPDVITSDVTKLDHVDRVENAYNLNFEDKSLKAIYMFDVLHHLGKVEKFFAEASRCLRPGGKLVMVEPYGSLWGRLFYKKMHHEPFEEKIDDWGFPDKGPLSSANGALPTVIFHRDIEKFNSLFPQLKVVDINYHTFLLYFLSGGLSLRQLMPSKSYVLWRSFEKLLKPFMKSSFGMFQTITIEKR